MDRFRDLLIVVGLAVSIATFLGSPAVADSHHTGSGGQFGVDAISDGERVTVFGQRSNVVAADRASTSRIRRQGSKASTLSAAQVQALFDAMCVGQGTCDSRRGGAVLNPLIRQRTPAPGATDAAEPARAVTVEDVARYAPSDMGLQIEPDGWAVVGVPTNFFTTVGQRTVRGQLLGVDADVRFTPRLYRWSYGDGTSATTETAGASWAALGVDEYSPTATSHVYRVKARVDVSVTVIWSAEYRVAGGDWTPVAGAVSSDSPELPVLVVAERTVLTDG